MNDKAPLVTILGAGIAGMTAAHELIERGFDVQVIEKNLGEHHAPDVGGVARTQWCVPPEHEEAEGLTQLVALNGIDWLGPEPWNWPTAMWFPLAIGAAIDAASVHKWINGGADSSSYQLVIVVYRRERERKANETEVEPTQVADAYALLGAFLAALAENGALGVFAPRFHALPVGRLEVDAAPGNGNVGLLIRRLHTRDLIAGEHGYRFFPGCYRHLRDTMRRTPIFDRDEHRFSTRTVHDNLTPLRYQIVADPTRDSVAAFSRQPPSSLAAVWKQYRDLRRDLGYRPADLLRFSLRLLRYMTSSTERRERYYENISWWDFLTRRHLDRVDDRRAEVGQRYRRVLEHALETVVAVKTNYADARTVGNFSVQLTTSGYGAGDVDSTLRGPSSDVWFKHWREYLKSRGVRFYAGEVTAIDTTSGKVDIELAPAPFDGAGYIKPRVEGKEQYVVCAMDAVSLARVVKNPQGVAADIMKFVPSDVERLDSNREFGSTLQSDAARARSRFQTLTGIQLYYQTRLSPDTSHIYYADSAWSLSAISQVQQWERTTAASPKLSSTLSINIGSWRARTTQGDVCELLLPNELAYAPPPDSLTPAEIAAEVTRQVSSGRAPNAPRAAYFHIDDYIEFARNEKLLPTLNRAPYLVNLVGDFEARPQGEPWSPASRKLRPRHLGDGESKNGLWTHRKGGYVVHEPGNIVFAGTHMRTFTRLTSMEAANESARHAVNAILDHLAPREKVEHEDSGGHDAHRHEARVPPFGAYCDIWDPEHHEFADLEFVRAIDKYLVESAKIDPLDADDLPADKREPAAPLHIFDLIGIDHLADMIETDASSERVFELLGLTLDGLQRLASKDASSVIGVIETFKKQFDELIRR